MVDLELIADMHDSVNYPVLICEELRITTSTLFHNASIQYLFICLKIQLHLL